MDKLAEIFQRQGEYMSRLTVTYLHNGFSGHKDWPWDLNGRKSQEEFRLLAWRFYEEIIEAYAASVQYREPSLAQSLNFREELSDALHFFIELCIVSGVNRPELLTGLPVAQWVDEGDSLERFFEVIGKTSDFLDHDPFHEVGIAIAFAMTKLKQRPWRTDFRPTDRREWVMGLHLTFRAFALLCMYYKVTPDQLHAAYFGKANVNEQRIKDHGVKS